MKVKTNKTTKAHINTIVMIENLKLRYNTTFIFYGRYFPFVVNSATSILNNAIEDLILVAQRGVITRPPKFLQLLTDENCITARSISLMLYVAVKYTDA